MRVSTYVLGVAAVLGTAAMGFAGCGGTVSTENAGSTTGAGTGGTTTKTMVTVTASVSSTAATTTTATSSSTSTTASSSSGGDAACDTACAHIDQCALGVTCAQLPANFNCSTVGTQYDCLFNCVAATPCASLGAGTLQTCQAQCAADGGAGDGGVNPGDGGVNPGDGGTANACQTCVPTSCTASIAPCAQDGTCQTWLMCTLGCIQANPPVTSCFQACDAASAAASALYTPVWDCACTSCSNECAAIDPCAHGADGGP